MFSSSHFRPLLKPWIAGPTVVFLGISVLLLIFLPFERHLVPDSSSYLNPAQRLIEGLPPGFHFRLPGYPVALALFLKVFGSPLSVVVGQMLAYLALAGMAHTLLRRLLGSAPAHTFALVLLFPSFVYAQLIIPDVFFAALMLGGLLAAVVAHQEERPAMALLAGAAFALMATLRTNAPFLGWSLVVGWLLWIGLQRPRSDMRTGFRSMTTNVFLVVGPFLVGVLTLMALHWSQGGGFSYMKPEYRRYTMHDQILYAEFLREPQSFEEARAKVYRRTREFEQLSEAAWEALPLTKKHGLVLDHTVRHLIGMGIGTLLRVMTLAEIRMMISNAQREWLDLVGMRALNMREAFMIDKVRGAPLSALAMYVLFALAVVVRALALVGLWKLMREREFAFLALTLVPIFVIILTSGFIAYSRYRLPVEPFLLMYTAIGIEVVRKKFFQGSRLTPSDESFDPSH